MLEERLDAAIEAVLLFHSGGPWDAAKSARWVELVGQREVTSRALCMWLRTLRTWP